ncbi:MAG: DNA recombination protein RmuC [Hahellaceae bacterium]|nr:DNA recombination protein RmuC [Hahellaceae bacterium]MCP5169719.1 DNA recombination protein RmuC [Hahellaceae bacterium]
MHFVLIGVVGLIALVVGVLIGRQGLAGQKQTQAMQALALEQQQAQRLLLENQLKEKAQLLIEKESALVQQDQQFRQLDLAHHRLLGEHQTLLKRKDEITAEYQALQSLYKTDAAGSQNRYEQSLQNLADLREQAKAAEVSAQRAEQQLQEMRLRLSEQETLRSEWEVRHHELNQAHAELKTRQHEKEQHFVEQLKLLEDGKQRMLIEFQNLANQIFEAKGKTFTETSKQSLDSLLAPLKQQMNEFRVKVEDIHHKETQQQAALRTELQQLQKLNQDMTAEAHSLATALKGQKKMQGNWGELVLENVLERSGLQLGKDYKREVSISTTEGRSRPDVVVYLPHNKHLIIDAKVSLNAYTRFVNAEDEAERKLALNDHVTAMAARIKELADRDYYKLPGLNSPEMVFMFVPIESAFVEALKADESLFQKAISLNVLVATPTTLLTSLNIVRQLWRFEEQNKHTAELANKAEAVFKKLKTFLGSMEGVKKALDKAQEAYAKAEGQLTSGPGNLVKQVNDFRQLAPAIKDQLPEYFTEKAELELDFSPQEDESVVATVS